MRAICIILLCIVPAVLRAQSYADTIAEFRRHYIEELLAEPRHPVNAAQAKSISFFPADRSYCVWADFVLIPGGKTFLVPTHSGKQKPFREYGTLTFYIRDSAYTLHAYQSVDIVSGTANKDHLFIPFNDYSNYETTYGGGRYIDLTINDIKDNKVLLDLNKCYNPYCAYADGFSCPIPPSENYLNTHILAGEKAFPR
jgi:uncharacterized protein (DUF1684 family)